MNFIINKDDFLKVKAEWTRPGRQHHLAVDHIFYNALRGHDLKRGFAPTTDERKLQGNVDAWRSFNTAKFDALWSLRTTSIWSGETEARIAMHKEKDQERFNSLSAKWGVEFTPELISTLKELLK